MAALARLLVTAAVALGLLLVGLVVVGVAQTARSTAPVAPAAVGQPPGIGDGSGVVARVSGRVERDAGGRAQGRLRAPSGAVGIAMRCAGDGHVSVRIGTRSTSADCRGGRARVRTGQFLSIGTEQVGWHVATTGRVAWAVTLSAG